MAAMSAASATANTITPPSSSHGNGNPGSWNNYAVGESTENSQDRKPVTKPDQANRAPLTQNGNSANIYDYGFEPLPPARKKTSNDNLSLSKGSKANRRDHDTSGKPGANSTDDVFGGKGAGVGEKRSTSDLTGTSDDDSSKWIHRDKLARIESEELQAAGIILPRARASSKPPRRGRSEEKLNGSTRRTTSAAAADEDPRPRSRKSSVSPESRVPEEKMPDLDVSSWDLRRPEEIATEGDGNYWASASTAEKKGISKIPVAKASPAPIPESYMERNAPSARRQSGGPSELETIAYPKPRPRSGSANTLGASSTLQPAKRNTNDTSPRKGSGGSNTTRKPSTQARGVGKPKTRGGKDSTSGTGTRPTTRSGDLSPGIKRPEGDPPWMVGTYKPDPRLPPEQQLLPTVARRLQQEQWEREGKYGSIYDKEFRPLTADGLLKPPEAGPSNMPADEEKQEHDEWPLKDASKSPTSSSIKQSASYSTMPKLSDKPQTSPLPSPRSPRSPMMQPQQPAQTQTVTRVPDQPSAANMSMSGQKKKSGGCGCCIVM